MPPATMEIPTDRIVTQLRERILNGQLPGGIQLRQERIAQEFGVSRIPVREALSRLEAEGLVTREHNRGCIVATMSLADLQESLDIRAALEGRALRLAIPRMTPADFAAVSDVLDRYAKATSPGQWTELNLEFHMTLYRPAGRPRLVRMIEDLIRGTDRYLRVYISFIVGRDDPLEEHRQILRACKERDVARAARLLEGHIERTQKALARATPESQPAELAPAREADGAARRRK
jgi:DNA-binding GntR family transcriptional regulator